LKIWEFENLKMHTECVANYEMKQYPISYNQKNKEAVAPNRQKARQLVVTRPFTLIINFLKNFGN